MFELRTRNIIVNDAAGRVVADNSAIAITGFPNIEAANVLAVKATRAQVAKVQINAAPTITAPGKAGEAIFYIKAKNSRHTAQYHWDRVEFGKTFPISISVLAGDDQAALRTKITAAIANQNALYEDLPFTAAVGTNIITGKADATSISWEANGGVITYDDGTTGDVAWSLTKTQVNSEGIGLGKQLEENVFMSLRSNGVISDEHYEETPAKNGKYSEFIFEMSFSSDIVAAPGFVGETSQSGTYELGVYVNEAELSDAEIDDMLDFIYALTGKFEATDASGAAAADKIAFLA